MAMNSELTTLLAQTTKSLDTILYIGAGSGEDLKAICDLQPNKVVAVEASDVLFASLQRKARKYNNVATINSWILPASCNRGTAYLCNNPRYNSLCEPTGLTKTYPNIALTDQQDISGKTIESLIDSLALNTNQLNVLVLSVQGGEAGLLRSVTYELLKSFTYIFIQAPQEGLYKDSWIRENNIDYFDPITFSGADQRIFIYKHNQEVAELAIKLGKVEQSLIKLQQENQDLSLQNNSLLLHLEDSRAAIEGLTEQTQKLQNDYQKAKVTSKEAEEQVAILEGQCQKHKAELVASRDNTNQLEETLQASELETQRLVSTNQNLIDENAKLADELASSKKQLLSELSQVKAQCEKEREHHFKNKEWAEGLAAEVKKLRQENEELLKFKTTNDQLNKKNNELEYRQVKLDEELNKAQVQLNLLTEILFSAGLSND